MNLDKFEYEKDGEYIYLVMVEYKDKTLLKIGYTSTLDTRMDTYELHNPDIQVLKIREGTRELENYFHKKFEEYAYPKRKEWFYYSEEIVESFDTLEEMNFLDPNKLKSKVYNLLKPKSIEDLKKIYYEKYQEEIKNDNLDKEELDHVVTNAFSHINENIEEFINTFDYSEIPLELDPNTHYQVIIPNPIDSVDISMDLEQILGRQRLKENPWKNCATMFVRTTNKKHKIEKNEYNKYLEDKIHTTELLLENYKNIDKNDNKYACAKTYQTIAEMCHYKDNYIAVSVIEKNWKTGEVLWLEPVFNNLMLVSEKRAFDVQQVDYKDRFSVFNAIGKENLEGVTLKACEMAVKFNEVGDSNKKLKILVGLKEIEGITDKDINSFLELIPPKYKRYYTVMGPEFIKTHSCLEAEINSEWKKKLSNETVDVNSEILKIFKTGDRYSKSDIKSRLADLYERLGYHKTAKATDLEALFNLKLVKVVEKDGKKSNGFEILGKR